MRLYKASKVRGRLLAERNRIDRMIAGKLPRGAKTHLRDARSSLTKALKLFPVPPKA